MDQPLLLSGMDWLIGLGMVISLRLDVDGGSGVVGFCSEEGGGSEEVEATHEYAQLPRSERYLDCLLVSPVSSGGELAGC